MNGWQRRRTKIIQWAMLIGGIALGLGYWLLTFDGCSFGPRCW